jgi:hypothetical protein
VGTTTITWTATDASHNHSSCTQNVVVNDTESPTLSVPAPITTEFNDENGAAVSFGVTSSDNCPGVTQNCSAASGAVFPIGTTAIQCTALDAHNNSTTKSFAITVLGTLGVKQDVLADMNNLHDANLARAIADLQQSLDPSLWIDQTHINNASVFQYEKDSVTQLMNLTRRRGADATLQNFVNRIVKADRLLSTVALNAAPNNSEAMSLRAKGDEFAASGQYEAAIEQYRNAWAKVH